MVTDAEIFLHLRQLSPDQLKETLRNHSNTRHTRTLDTLLQYKYYLIRRISWLYKMSTSLQKLLLYTGLVAGSSVAYYIYAFIQMPKATEHETFLSELGEGVGELAMWALIFIYFRTALKLVMGKGPISRRLLPEYTAPPAASVLKKMMVWLDRTHVHVGIASTALIILHVVLMGSPLSNLFFPAVLALVAWQAMFGFFLRWRSAPKEVRKLSFSVHAQLLTGVMMGIFAYFGHLLVDA
jgi:hypothetical protein